MWIANGGENAFKLESFLPRTPDVCRHQVWPSVGYCTRAKCKTTSCWKRYGGGSCSCCCWYCCCWFVTELFLLPGVAQNGCWIWVVPSSKREDHCKKIFLAVFFVFFCFFPSTSWTIRSLACLLASAFWGAVEAQRITKSYGLCFLLCLLLSVLLLLLLLLWFREDAAWA